MITSDRQLDVTNKKIADLKASLAQKADSKLPMVVVKAARAQTQALINGLQDEVDEYMRLRNGGIAAIHLSAPQDIFSLPIQYRIAKHLTQEAFAQLVGVSVRQVARYESECYENVNTDTFKKILEKMPLDWGQPKVAEKKLG